MSIRPASLDHRPFRVDSPRFLPWGGSFGLEDFDYVEEEWFASGEEQGRPFTTWMLVRRPRDPSRFSGTVIVEPLHAYPISPIFLYTSRYIMRSGHGWACVGSQKTSIDINVRPSNP